MAHVCMIPKKNLVWIDRELWWICGKDSQNGRIDRTCMNRICSNFVLEKWIDHNFDFGAKITNIMLVIHIHFCKKGLFSMKLQNLKVSWNTILALKWPWEAFKMDCLRSAFQDIVSKNWPHAFQSGQIWKIRGGFQIEIIIHWNRDYMRYKMNLVEAFQAVLDKILREQTLNYKKA